MHWGTYYRIQSRATAVEAEVNHWAMRVVAKLER